MVIGDTKGVELSALNLSSTNRQTKRLSVNLLDLFLFLFFAFLPPSVPPRNQRGKGCQQPIPRCNLPFTQ